MSNLIITPAELLNRDGDSNAPEAHLEEIGTGLDLARTTATDDTQRMVVDDNGILLSADDAYRALKDAITREWHAAFTDAGARHIASPDFGEVWGTDDISIALDTTGTPAAYAFAGNWDDHDDAEHVAIDHPGETQSVLDGIAG